MSKMMKCKTCGADIAKSAKICPHCGAKNKKPFFKRWWFWVLVVFLLLCILGSSGNSYTVGTPEYNKLSRSEYIGRCAAVSYTDVARNPDNYRGELLAVTGEVVQVLEDGRDVQMRLEEDADNWETDYVWYVFYTLADGEGRILEGDSMTIYGECVATVSYESVLGNTVTIPAILAKYHS